MKIAQIIKADVANGLGTRLSIFVSGCEMHCEGCFNKAAWDFDYGKEFSNVDIITYIIKELKNEYYHGLSILGGEPLHPKNIIHVASIVDSVKRYLPEKNIWLYTGYAFEEFKDSNIYSRDEINARDLILGNVDVIADGKFELDKKCTALPFRGSSNQRLIDVKQSMELDSVIELKL